MTNINGASPEGGNARRGFPAVGYTQIPPAYAEQGLLRHHSCDQAQPHRCSPKGTMEHTDTITLILNTLSQNFAFTQNKLPYTTNTNIIPHILGIIIATL